MTQQHEQAARAAGWFNWFGIWLHSAPWESPDHHRPAYWIGTARELCLSQGILTGEPL